MALSRYWRTEFHAISIVDVKITINRNVAVWCIGSNREEERLIGFGCIVEKTISLLGQNVCRVLARVVLWRIFVPLEATVQVLVCTFDQQEFIVMSMQ